MPRQVNLNESELAIFHVTIAFLVDRLEERATINWALQLDANDAARRLAITRLVDSKEDGNIDEPWRSAWRLIKESWDNSTGEDYDSSGLYDVKRRLRAGDRSASLAKAIVEIVAPRLKVEAFSKLDLHFRKPPKRPKRIQDLFSMGLTSGPVINPSELELGVLNDGRFLQFLAVSLDAAVIGGLQLGRQIGWDERVRPWQLGQLHRVYYVSASERAEREHEPDEFHRGIAPAVKLLYAVVSRLADIDISAATGFASRWKLVDSPIHLRFWAALARDVRIVPIDEVAAFILSRNDQQFWNVYDYPEITELRARRFRELDSPEQKELTARIRKGPPRNQWPKKTAAHDADTARLYWSLRDLKRIEIAGASLPQSDKIWMDAKINEFPDLASMERLDDGFLNLPKAQMISPNPDDRYNSLFGEERLRALEAALASASSGWVDDPAERASAWIHQNTLQILGDLESVRDEGAAFSRVWERFGWAHSPNSGQGGNVAQRDLRMESARVLSLLVKLPEATLHDAVDGISHWLSAWDKQIVAQP